jgi:hypothetical protein
MRTIIVFLSLFFVPLAFAQSPDSTLRCNQSMGKDYVFSYCRMMAFTNSNKTDHDQLNRYTTDCMKTCLGKMGVANPVLPVKPFDEPLKYKPEEQK